MFTNVAYLHNSLNDTVDTSKSLVVTSCGYYRVHSRPVVATERPTGRKDYQLLYIAKGKGHFFFEGKEHIITEGNMILYRPNETQMYYYYAPDKTEVYWIHFTGRMVEGILDNYEMPRDENVFYTGNSPDYTWLYRQIIQELQLCRPNYEELIAIMLRHIFIMINRYIKEGRKTGSDIQNEIERATHYFNENYNKPLNIDEYAESRYMSTCWFIRNFKQSLDYLDMTLGSAASSLYNDVMIAMEDEFQEKYYKNMDSYNGLVGIARKTIDYRKINYKKANELIDEYEKKLSNPEQQHSK